ncbi:MAG: hypothetical protein HY077_10330 [Elusimicrobia bacterium]|nr:hypothetical protein [Elusimicrobiota bacterium]
MAGKNNPHPRIELGLPDIQRQLVLVKRMIDSAVDHERQPLQDLGNMLSELYSQFQHQKQITVYRYSAKSRSRAD